MKQHSDCDDEEGNMTVFYLTLPHYSSAGEKQFICFTAAACWQNVLFICITPGLNCSEQQNNAKSNPHFQTEKDKLLSVELLFTNTAAWYLKDLWIISPEV